MRMGEGCVSPIQPTGKCKNPQCDACSIGETLKGSAGGANCCGVTGMVTASNREPPLASATSLGKVSSVAMASSCGIMLALSCTQPLPRSGSLRLRVRDEQHVSPLRPTPTEKLPDSVWTAPTNRHPTLANTGGQQWATERLIFAQQFPFETREIGRTARAILRLQAAAKTRVSRCG